MTVLIVSTYTFVPNDSKLQNFKLKYLARWRWSARLHWKDELEGKKQVWTWSSLLVEGDEGCIGRPKWWAVMFLTTPKNVIMQHMHGNIPYKFECWAKSVVHLLLLKSFTVHLISFHVSRAAATTTTTTRELSNLQVKQLPSKIVWENIFFLTYYLPSERPLDRLHNFNVTLMLLQWCWLRR